MSCVLLNGDTWMALNDSPPPFRGGWFQVVNQKDQNEQDEEKKRLLKDYHDAVKARLSCLLYPSV